MHELSIAAALFEQVKEHAPAGARVLKVNVLIGPMQGVEPDSLRFGWEATCKAEGVADVPELVLTMPQWKLTCNGCGRVWESRELYVSCECGNALPQASGGGELQLTSIEIEETQ